ncbi:NAD(P)H-hydrate dehydratase [Cohnella fermenti]|uniref:Bifunctional NAD(P)H-hydrate repair enzyme n=1 Tax=Cohnella fermenti TaxID=2565925 RepID=A0A4S4BST1_9BACL|nr:NAD(P)H-hydrate dehydratase [Cohnella fermenti]THF78077.1 NAD(P)H-hydrate dehydratase [Cohnella fermenti]
MYLVTSEEMRRIDRHTIEEIGIPALVLMENAGRAIAEEAVRLAGGAMAEWNGGRMERVRGPAERRDGLFGGEGLHGSEQSLGDKERMGGGAKPFFGRRCEWLVLVGKGNNGGDGLVCARHLIELGHGATVLYAVPPEQLVGEAAIQRDIAARLGIPAMTYAPGVVDWRRVDGIVDSLLGTGSKGAPREPYASLIREANASGRPIVAADIPSGLDADTGELAEPSIRAELTVALAMCKRGLLLYPGAEHAGRVVVRGIGIPEAAAEPAGVRTFALSERTRREKLGVSWPQARKADTHKGTYGHVLVAAGSRPMSGAGLLAARAALRSGSGLVSLALPDSLLPALLGRLPEAMLLGMPDAGRGDWSAAPPEALAAAAAGKQALVLGPGLGRWTNDRAWLRTLWERLPGSLPLVLDADALNMLAAAEADGAPGGGEPFAAWPRRAAPAVVTPHPGEMARMCGLSVREVQRDRIELARRYAEEHGVIVALKGARTVVAEPGGRVFVNATGNPGMATGGSGDVLAGLIGGLLAQGHGPIQAAALGVWLHGAAGDRAASVRTTQASLLAGDIIDHL